MKKLLLALIFAVIAITVLPVLNFDNPHAVVRAESTVDTAETPVNAASQPQAAREVPAAVQIAAGMVCLLFGLIAVFPLFAETNPGSISTL